MKTDKKVNAFEVLKVMSERNMDIQLAPTSNIIGVTKVKGGYEVKIGVQNTTGLRLVSGEIFNGGLLLANSDQFKEIEKELTNSIHNPNKG